MVRKLSILCVALGAAAFAWAAAPALSLEPYAPAPVEFEQQLEDFSYLSGTIEAPGRFDAVGIVGEQRPYEIRVRESGGEWSEWTPAVDGSPVWAGGADELQIRIHGGVDLGDLHYVNVSGDASPVDGALTAMRSAVSTAVVAVASVTPAIAAPPRPRVRRRRFWDPDGDCPPRTVPAYGRVKAATVHHTVSTNDYTRREVAGMVLAICRYHRNGNGWNDIGYNALVDRFGRVWEGRSGGLNRRVVGAHNQGFNSQVTGVAVLGTHTTRADRITRRTLRGLVQFLAWKLARHGQKAIGRSRVISGGGSVNRYPSGRRVRLPRVHGHRETNHTACPGDGIGLHLRKLRRRAQHQISKHGGPEQPDGSGDPDSGGTGEPEDPAGDESDEIEVVVEES